MGDINIDSHNKKSIGYKELHAFMDSFGLKNLIKPLKSKHPKSLSILTKFCIPPSFD